MFERISTAISRVIGTISASICFIAAVKAVNDQSDWFALALFFIGIGMLGFFEVFKLGGTD